MIVDCPNCEVNIEASLLHEYVRVNPYEPVDQPKYKFLKCPKCASPFLTVEELEYFAGKFVYEKSKQLFPYNEFHINPEIPKKLREALNESIKCYRSRASTATVIMCRRTIEGFCQLKNSTKKTLAQSIEELKERQIINEQLYEWATELRLSGNEAAHNIHTNFNQTDAKDTLDFTIAILDFSYSFKEKFDKFKERRKAVTNIKHGIRLE